MSAVSPGGHGWPINCCIELQDGRLCSGALLRSDDKDATRCFHPHLHSTGGDDSLLVLWDAAALTPVARLEVGLLLLLMNSIPQLSPPPPYAR